MFGHKVPISDIVECSEHSLALNRWHTSLYFGFLYESEIMKVPFQKVMMKIKQDNSCEVLHSGPAHSRGSFQLAIMKTVGGVLQKLGLRQVTSSFQEPAFRC